MGLKESGLRGSLRNVSVGIDAIPDPLVKWSRVNPDSGAVFEGLTDIDDADGRDGLRIGNDDGNWADEFYHIEDTYDVSIFDEMNLFTEGIEIDPPEIDMVIEVGGDELLREGDDHSFEFREFDISDYGADTTFRLGVDLTSDTGTETREVSFSDIVFE